MTVPKLGPYRLTWAIFLVGSFCEVQLAGQDLPTAKPEDVGVSSTKVEELSTFMQSLVDQGKIAGGVTMMARHGKVVHLKAVGMADREEKKPMQTDAIFRIASMTKPITSVAILMLWEDGKLDLDDPVSKYIPEFKNPQVLITADPLKTVPAKREITILDLLTHTSGLSFNSDNKLGPIYEKNGIHCGLSPSQLNLKELMKKLAVMPILFHPGDRWNYSMSTDVLGRVVEVVSGVTLDRFVESRICHPLGMNDTFFMVPPEKRHRLVAAYLPAGDGIRKMGINETITFDAGGPVPLSCNYCFAESNSYLSGGGGLCSTASDYWRFCQMLLNGGESNNTRLLRPETVRTMTTSQPGDWQCFNMPDRMRLGVGILPDKEGVHDQLRGAYAWSGFWSTSFRISPRGKWVVIALSQLAPNGVAPQWFVRYETLAAEAIER